MEQQTGSKLGKKYIKAVYCHPSQLTYLFHALAIVNSTAMNTRHICLFHLWFPQGICPVEGLLDHILLLLVLCVCVVFFFLQNLHIILCESEITKSCPTLCNPMDCSLPVSTIYGIFQARTPDWVAVSFSRGSSWPRDRTQVSRIAGRCFTIWVSDCINLHSHQ